jgi:hypothetical protein
MNSILLVGSLFVFLHYNLKTIVFFLDLSILFAHIKSHPTIGLIGTSVGVSPVSAAAFFGFADLL